LTGTLLAFDYGRARVGVASGNRLTGSAGPLEPLDAGDSGRFWRDIQSLFDDWKPVTVVVGLPLSMDGSETPISAQARAFADALEKRFGIPVILHDERLTSREAQSRFAEARAGQRMRRRDRRLLDSMAATLIAESWLAEQPPA